MKLKDAIITGFVTNPRGDSTCAHCGMGIKHCVIVRDPETGKEVPIGTTCAERVGIDADMIRNRETTEQKTKRIEREEAQTEKDRAEWERKETEHKKTLIPLRSTIDQLNEIAEQGNVHNQPLECTFLGSLAAQLERRLTLSPRQSEFVCKALVGSTGRRNKKNAKEWDALFLLISGFEW